MSNLGNGKYSFKVADEAQDFFEVDKSEIEVNQIVDNLFALIKNSKYTFAEVAERLCWTEGQLVRALSGNFDLDVFDITHIAGAAGYGIDVSFYKIGDDNDSSI